LQAFFLPIKELSVNITAIRNNIISMSWEFPLRRNPSFALFFSWTLSAIFSLTLNAQDTKPTPADAAPAAAPAKPAAAPAKPVAAPAKPAAAPAKPADDDEKPLDGTTKQVKGCVGCYLTFGVGAAVNSKGLTDYNQSANLIQATHLGNATPLFSAGLSIAIPLTGPLHFVTQCDEYTDKKGKVHEKVYAETPDEKLDNIQVYCYPWRVFTSVKFAPDASQTFNGFSFGLSHRIAKPLDLMLGISFSAFNEVTPGFQRAAIQTVTDQQTAITHSTM
jgi:hypothetical protein